MKDSTFSTMILVMTFMIASLPFVMGYDNVSAPEKFSVAENGESVVTLTLDGQSALYIAKQQEDGTYTLTQLTNRAHEPFKPAMKTQSGKFAGEV